MNNPANTKSWINLLNLKFNGDFGFGCVSDNALPINIDFSNAFISDEIWTQLLSLADEQNVEQWRDRMFDGDAINVTENRAVGHVWLRSGDKDEVQDVLLNMKKFVDKAHAENKFTDIVHIGIGGSDLGPRLVCDTLKHIPKKMDVHFVANIDGADIAEALKPLNPKTTLIIVASKTFTTIETMMNAKFARAWLGDLDVADHMIALSTNADAVDEFGIDTDNMFPFWDWVGGRYSVWSAIGMPIALTYGFDVFQEFLNGAKSIDDHFKNTELKDNLPVLLALFGIWNRNFMKRPAMAVLPYAQNLALLPNFLQQVDMESNGKHVDRDGSFINGYETGPIIFGQAGTNGQHAFHQWLHQGTDIVPCEFIKITKSTYDKKHQKILNANADAQAKTFAKGARDMDNAHKNYMGGRPSITINCDDLSPFTLGAIIALYEHKIFVQGIIWNINSFDQFGVELGKKMANDILDK